LDTKIYIGHSQWVTAHTFSTSLVIPFCTALKTPDSGFVSLPATSPAGY